MTTPFSSDYVAARDRFRVAAASAGWQLEDHPIGAIGPDGEQLTIDVAVSATDRSNPTLVLSSGLHGVEGFFGSAVQIEALEAWPSRRDAEAVRCVMLHGLNPFGFAWRRRFNEKNVDLNRNFLLEGQAFTGCPDRYPQLDCLLNPKRRPSRMEPVTAKLMLAIARYGMPALKESVAGGQYEYPKGLFYGGSEPSRTSEILRMELEKWLAGSKRVIHLDLHTGLGPGSSCKLIIDYELGPNLSGRLDRWFGAGTYEEAESKGVSYKMRGSLGPWCRRRADRREYVYLAAEFGTYPTTQVLAGLRAENQAHHWGTKNQVSTCRAKERLEELFCPRSTNWRTTVLAKAGSLVTRAIGALTDNMPVLDSS